MKNIENISINDFGIIGYPYGKTETVSYLTQYTNNVYGLIKKLNVKDKPIKIL